MGMYFGGEEMGERFQITNGSGDGTQCCTRIGKIEIFLVWGGKTKIECA